MNVLLILLVTHKVMVAWTVYVLLVTMEQAVTITLICVILILVWMVEVVKILLMIIFVNVHQAILEGTAVLKVLLLMFA